MTPQTQLILGPPNGDCLRACIASVLDLPIAELPNPHGDGWWDAWLDWLSKRGLTAEWAEPAEPSDGYWIACVPSPRIPGVDHSVVMHGSAFVWDPHPDAVPLDQLDAATIIDSIRIVGSGRDSGEENE